LRESGRDPGAGARLAAIDVSELALRNLVARAPGDSNGVLTLAVHERVAALSVTCDAALYVTRWCSSSSARSTTPTTNWDSGRLQAC
jgi:hypothetical protein